MLIACTLWQSLDISWKLQVKCKIMEMCCDKRARCMTESRFTPARPSGVTDDFVLAGECYGCQCFVQEVIDSKPGTAGGMVD